MAKENEFCEHLVDLLSPLGEVTYRHMFGGHGIYVDGHIVAIAADAELYLKADEVNRPRFEELGMERFQPFPGRDTAMPYHRVAAEMLDDRDRLLELARTSVEVARRSAARRKD